MQAYVAAVVRCGVRERLRQRAALTPEGHGVRYDADGNVIGVTIVNAPLAAR
ncbi:MAG: DUF2283 domain-containing protein [Solirubrobacteraceae bacterium]